MPDIYLIGDSHAELLDESVKKIGGYNNISISSKTAFVLNFDTMADLPKTLAKDSIVALMFGYVDTLRYHDKYREYSNYLSPPEIAKLYVDKGISFFNDVRLIFVQPMLQFKYLHNKQNMILSPFDVRYEHSRSLSESIEKYAKLNNKEYISLNAHFGQDYLERSINDNDHLTEEQNVAKTKYILERIKNV